MSIEDLKKEIKEELKAVERQNKADDKKLKAEILSIKDTRKRQQMIKENLRLFN